MVITNLLSPSFEPQAPESDLLAGATATVEVAVARADESFVGDDVSGAGLLAEGTVEARVDAATWLLDPVEPILEVLVGNTALTSPIVEVVIQFELEGAGWGGGVAGCPWKNVEEP